MGFLDRLLGRGKKVAGDIKGDESLRREGMRQEREGMAEDRADADVFSQRDANEQEIVSIERDTEEP
jgi:uncharacterized protein YjbJ (UPF0337 family)